MILTIDIGNTNVVAGLWAGDECVSQLRVETVLNPNIEALFTELKTVDAVIIGSVVPVYTQLIEQHCKQHDIPFFNVDYTTKTPISIALDNPKQLGADRLINAVAADAIYQKSALVIDFGTATTFDVVIEQTYLGGVIAPGIELSLEALGKRAVKLPHIDLKPTQQITGKNTKDAMQAGVYYGYIGLIKEIVAGLQKENPKIELVLATGGLAGIFSEALNCIDVVDQELTLKGLKIIYGQVTQK